jgi:hypothetical protein
MTRGAKDRLFDVPFEEAVKRILKAGPMPKSKPKPKGKKAPKVRPKVTK